MQRQSPAGGLLLQRPPPGPADSEDSSVIRAIVAVAAARLCQLGRFKCKPGHSACVCAAATGSGPGSPAGARRLGRLQPGHNLGRPCRAWATGSEPLSPIFHVTDKAALNTAPRPATHWQAGPGSLGPQAGSRGHIQTS